MNVQQLFKNHKWGDQIIHEQENILKAEEQRRHDEYMRKIQEERDERRRKHLAKIDAYVQKNGPYWRYNEADTYVELKKYSGVPAMDKANQMRVYFMTDKDGNEELMVVMTLVGTNKIPYTVDEYHAIFCEKKNYNGEEIWVYKGR